jgi:hypothetical protein
VGGNQAGATVEKKEREAEVAAHALEEVTVDLRRPGSFFLPSGCSC